ncbi:MAG: hypothetical protein GX587_15700 [Bacteroidales bacterium]|nr:hypothetical protein [Bacteroidales bacterium]
MKRTLKSLAFILPLLVFSSCNTSFYGALFGYSSRFLFQASPSVAQINILSNHISEQMESSERETISSAILRLSTSNQEENNSDLENMKTKEEKNTCSFNHFSYEMNEQYW